MDQLGENAFELPLLAVNNLTCDFTFDQRRINFLKLFSLKTVYEMLARFNIYIHITDEEISNFMYYLPFPKQGELTCDSLLLTFSKFI